MGNKISITAALLLSVFVLTGSVQAQDGPPPAKVKVAPVVMEEIAQTRTVIGLLYYDRISNISTELAGLVESVEVKQGDMVEKDAPLVLLNTEILDKEIAFQESKLKQIDLRIANVKKNYDRLEKLFGKSGVSERDRDDALFNYESAQIDKQGTEATLQKMQIQKKRSVIKAPFSGIILTKNVDAGSWVSPGTQLVSIGSAEDLFIRAPIAENLLKFVSKGQQLPVKITAFDKEMTGTLVDIDPVANQKTKNVYLKIAIEPLPLVAQNMTATVAVPASEKQNLAIINRASVIKFQGKDFVYTVKDDKASILPVHIVAYLGERVGVDNPYIVPGMPVVTEGNERLQPNQPVMIGE